MDDDLEAARRRTSERIAEVRARFVAGLPDKVATLSALARAAGGPDRPAAAQAYDGLRLGLHNLAGGAPTLGLSGLGEAAAALERQLIDNRQADGGIDPATAAELDAGVARLAGAA